MEGFVKRMITDLWKNNFCEESETFSPSIQQVLHAIADLNADTKTLIVMHGNDGSTLCIGGGQEKYVAFAAKSDENIWNVVSNSTDSGIVLLNIGGQEGEYFHSQLISSNDVILAASSFFKDGRLDKRLQWEKQD